MTPARPSDYVFSRTDADRMPDAVAGMSVPVLDANGRPAFSPRREDVLLLAEMARERVYLSKGLNQGTYEDERKRTVACDLSPHVRTRLPFDLLNDTVFHVGDLPPLVAGNDRIRYFGTDPGYDLSVGVVNPDADVFDGTFSYPMFGESGSSLLSGGFPDVARALQVPDYGSRCPSRAETAMGTSDSVRTLYWTLSRMRRYAYTVPWECVARDRFTWQDFSDYGPGDENVARVIPVVLLSSPDGKTTFYRSWLSREHDEDDRYYDRVVTDAPYETDGYSYLYLTKSYSPYDPSVVATSFNENSGMLFGIRPHYVWYGSTYDASRTTWRGPSDVMLVFTYSYSWFGTGDDGSGPDAGAGSFPVLFPIKGGAAAPARATNSLLLRRRLQATCQIMSNSVGGTNIAADIMPALMLRCRNEAVLRDPSFGQRPESETLILSSFTVLVDRTPRITPPDDWTWKPED